MAKVLKCDRCGKIFTEKDTLIKIEMGGAPLENSLMTFTKKEAEEHIFHRYRFYLDKVDLCEKCLSSLSKWFDEGDDTCPFCPSVPAGPHPFG